VCSTQKFGSSIQSSVVGASGSLWSMAGIESLQVRPFEAADVDSWAQTEHQRHHLALAVAASGDYLAAVQPDGRVVGKIGIRYDEHPGAGTLHQFDVVEELRGLGIGSLLLEQAELRIRDRGYQRSTLAVEESNSGAIRLYQRQGYELVGAEDAEWDQEAPDGTIYRYHCRCLLMERTQPTSRT